MKYILVTGGVISGIGKGVVTSSLGALLKACNLRVTAIKIDPYLNIDAGTFSPREHGEVFVLDDGCEVDLDLGNYERFLDVRLQRSNNITTGKIYQQVIDRERQGGYLGKTVQIVPHVTQAIREWIETTAKGSNQDEEPEICLIELGGTVGDIESMPFIEALRQLQRQVSRKNFCSCLVNLVPCIVPSKEPKTKPTQMSVRNLRSYGLYPDMIVCRSEELISDEVKEKISSSCDIEIDRIFSLPDLPTLYKVPTFLQSQRAIQAIGQLLEIDIHPSEKLNWWSNISDVAVSTEKEISIALVGKYTSHKESYTSVINSLEHACYHIGRRPLIHFIDSSELEKSEDERAWSLLRGSDCLLVPGGFDNRGTSGKILAIRWARKNKVPFLGICLGFQLAVIEFARDELSLVNANSEEFSNGKSADADLIVVEMLEYLDPDRKKGGTMRLGLRATKFVTNDSILRELYDNQDVIYERHRHRYEINPERIKTIENKGLRFVGKNDDETRMEILELERDIHPYFVAVQYHPEFLSKPFKPSPPYLGLVKAAREYSRIRVFPRLSAQ